MYARLGRQFKSSELTGYFNQQSWYHGTIPADQFLESSLNDVQRKNADFLRETEHALNNGAGYQLDQPGYSYDVVYEYLNRNKTQDTEAPSDDAQAFSNGERSVTSSEYDTIISLIQGKWYPIRGSLANIYYEFAGEYMHGHKKDETSYSGEGTKIESITYTEEEYYRLSIGSNTRYEFKLENNNIEMMYCYGNETGEWTNYGGNSLTRKDPYPSGSAVPADDSSSSANSSVSSDNDQEPNISENIKSETETQFDEGVDSRQFYAAMEGDWDPQTGGVQADGNVASDYMVKIHDGHFVYNFYDGTVTEYDIASVGKNETGFFIRLLDDDGERVSFQANSDNTYLERCFGWEEGWEFRDNNELPGSAQSRRGSLTKVDNSEMGTPVETVNADTQSDTNETMTSIVHQIEVCNCNEYVTLRNIPSGDGESLAQIPLGTALTGWKIPDYNFAWCNYNGQHGFVNADYLRDYETKSPISSYNANGNIEGTYLYQYNINDMGMWSGQGYTWDYRIESAGSDSLYLIKIENGIESREQFHLQDDGSYAYTSNLLYPGYVSRIDVKDGVLIQHGFEEGNSYYFLE